MHTGNKHTSHAQSETSEISIFEIFEILQSRLRELLVVIFIVPSLALGLTLTLDQTYEARALIRIAQIGEIRQSSNGSNTEIYSRPIEQMDNIIFRIKSPGFSENLHRFLGFPAKVEAEKAGTLVSVTAKARTREAAIAVISATKQLLEKAHNEKLKEATSILHTELERVKEELSFAKHSLRKAMESNYKKTDPSGHENRAVHSLGNVTMEQITNLRKRQTDLETALSSHNAWQTGVVDVLTAPLEPTHPNRGLILKISLAIGVVLGILTCLFREGLARRREITEAKGRDLS